MKLMHMSRTKGINNMIRLCSAVLLVLFISSCNTTNQLCYLFVGGYYQQEASLFFHSTSSIYVYSNYDYQQEFYETEIGSYRISNDTLVLMPKTTIYGDSISKAYDNGHYLTNIGDSVIFDIPSTRYYLIGKNAIRDITKDYYFPNDSCASSTYEDFSLKQIRLSKSRGYKVYKQNYVPITMSKYPSANLRKNFPLDRTTTFKEPMVFKRNLSKGTRLYNRTLRMANKKAKQ